METTKLIECPRDAWQGLEKIIPTAAKAEYLRTLIEAGFRHLDAVSFVSPKHVPQMADSEQVMERLRDSGAIEKHKPEIIGIVVNEKGMERALATRGVTTLGYPYSISAYFRRANANMSREESRRLVEQLKSACDAAGRGLVVYISMAFGNPYDEPWGPEIVADTFEWLKAAGIRQLSLADTVGMATPRQVRDLFLAIARDAEGLEVGVHLHSRPDSAAEKVLAAYDAGCRRFDAALAGLGGCPFAGDDLVGNIPTETVVATLAGRGVDAGISGQSLDRALEATRELSRHYAHRVVQ
jgi:hydroxymethylglutaryl-CoA lyase